MQNSIYDFLINSADKEHVSFHMPGHKGRKEIYTRYGYGDFLNEIIRCDITEIPGADSLQKPASTLRQVMDNYAELYGARHTELLVNGSSAGVMAAILSSVPVGGKLILGRNSHKSAYSALRLGGINPIYIRPEIDDTYALAAGISPYALEDACKANPDAAAVLITSPNYYGMLSDISLLSDVAHDYGMIMIVDQAHGAHLKFFDYDAKALRDAGKYVPCISHAAETLGADIAVNSTHKTLLSFTGSGILNICGDSIDIDMVRETLGMLQTTSPSYLLMGSLDINERIMREHGKEILSSWKSDLEFFYRNAAKIDGLTVVGGRDIHSAGGRESASEPSDEIFPLYNYREGLDPTKINISMSGLGLDGTHLYKELCYKNIIGEMAHGDYLLLMSGVGNSKSDYERLLDALSEIASSYGVSSEKAGPRSFDFPIPELSDVPIEYEMVPLFNADGRVAYDPIIAYPPGCPIVCPGEIMSMKIISCISEMMDAGDSITGVDDEGMIKVGI